MSNGTSDWAYDTGRTLTRNLSLTAKGAAAVREADAKEDAEAARKRQWLLAEVRAVLIGRMVK